MTSTEIVSCVICICDAWCLCGCGNFILISNKQLMILLRLLLGSPTPLKADNLFATYFHGVDGMGDIYSKVRFFSNVVVPNWCSVSCDQHFELT